MYVIHAMRRPYMYGNKYTIHCIRIEKITIQYIQSQPYTTCFINPYFCTIENQLKFRIQKTFNFCTIKFLGYKNCAIIVQLENRLKFRIQKTFNFRNKSKFRIQNVLQSYNGAFFRCFLKS